MSLYERAFRARGREIPSPRGERRGFKIPGLSKLRIGGSVGAATEKLKHAKVAGIPLYAGWQVATGNPVGAFETIRDGHSVQQGLDDSGKYLVQGAKNLPLALGLGPGGSGSGAGVAEAASAIANSGGGGSGGGGVGNLLDLGLGGLSAYNAAKLGQKSEDFATGANDMAQANWKSREPLRLAGVEGMLHPQPSSDLAGLGQVAQRNAFAPKPKPPLVMGGA